MTSEQQQQLDKILSDVYYKPNSAVAFAGVKAVYDFLKKEGHKFSLKLVREWVQNQDVFQRHKQPLTTFPRRHTYVFSLKQLGQMDLIDMSSLARWNANIHFLLILINAFSKKVFVRPLRNKSAVEVAKKLDDILSGLGDKPFKSIQSDKGW